MMSWNGKKNLEERKEEITIIRLDFPISQMVTLSLQSSYHLVSSDVNAEG